MIIIIPGADFSTKNIGQVQVPIQWDVDALAYRTAIPAAAATFDYAKNKALNTFFKALKSNGIWSKIDSLYLPLFGYQEGSKNLKDPNSDNLGLPAPGAIASYSNKGVLFAGIFVKAGTVLAAKFNDSHFGFYNTTAGETTDTAQRVGIGIGPPAGSGFFVGRRTSTGANTCGFVLSSEYRAIIPNHDKSIGAMIGCANASLKLVGVQSGAEYRQFIGTEAQAFPSPTSPRSIIIGSYRADTLQAPLNTSIGLITLGAYLNEAEVGLYSTLQATLMNALTA